MGLCRRVLMAVTFAMLVGRTREGGFLPGALVPPEDRPVATRPARAARDAFGAEDAGMFRTPRRTPTVTDRDAWRWSGRTYIGDQVVAP